MNNQKQDAYLKEWQSLEERAEMMLPMIGRLYRDHNIVTTVYGRSLVHSTAIDILKAHRFARLILDTELSVRETFPVLEAMTRLDLAPARIDLGRLTVRYQTRGEEIAVEDFVRRELAAINTGRSQVLLPSRRISSSTASAASAACWPAS